jgi:hypothetical protein
MKLLLLRKLSLGQESFRPNPVFGWNALQMIEFQAFRLLDFRRIALPLPGCPATIHADHIGVTHSLDGIRSQG